VLSAGLGSGFLRLNRLRLSHHAHPERYPVEFRFNNLSRSVVPVLRDCMERGPTWARCRERAWSIVLGVIAAVIIAVPVSMPIVNDGAAIDVESRLMDLPVPAGEDRIDSMAQAGRIVGNGNGIQYVGALLIQSEDSVGEPQGFYIAQAREADLSIAVTPADDLEREGFHGGREFLAHPGEHGTFVVHAWGEAPGRMFEAFDLRGPQSP
jgi:hypothetical protein